MSLRTRVTWNLRAKLLASFLGVAALLAAVGGIGLSALSSLRSNAHQTAQQVIVPLTAAQKTYNDLQYSELIGMAAYVYPSMAAQTRQQSIATEKKFGPDMQAVLSSDLPNAQARSIAEQLQKELLQYQKFALANQSNANLTQAESNTAQALTNAMSTDAGKLVSLLTAKAEAADHSSANAYSSARTLLTIALIVGLVLAVGAAFAISALMVRPIRRTMAVLGNVANGDLTQRLDIDSTDELGQMAESLNTTISTVQDVIRQIDSDASTLSGYAHDTSEHTRRLAVIVDRLAAIVEDGDAASKAQLDHLVEAAEQSAESLSGMAENLNAMISIFEVGSPEAEGPATPAVAGAPTAEEYFSS